MKKINQKFFTFKLIKLTILLIFSNLPIIIKNSESKIQLIENSEEEFNIENASFYYNEICSYNQIEFKFIKENNTIKCNCTEGYLSYNHNNEIKFGDHNIQCNYEQKRGYIVFFFSVFALLGIEHFYLENYYFFILIMVLYLGTIILKCRFVIAENLKIKQSKREESKLIKILPFICLIVWIINLIFVLSHQYKDGNDQLIFWDIKDFLGF
jgi:hypothetical protein